MRVRVFIEVKSGKWTIWSEDGKRHLGYRKSLALQDVEFHVDQKKRAHVKKTGKRLPHAWATGILTKKSTQTRDFREVTYDPFTHRYFQKSGRKITKANRASFSTALRVFAI
ncbi:hypothetical protein [Bdellovibrio sp. BCCA]|uniref:hypothetical protein n=1 Tax=Bdellovibrio sp. BCCA TaxID=3136281 RepID=UPI00403FCB86